MKIIAILIALCGALPAYAQDRWPLDEMNRVIESTNFRVGSGCSGTLVNINPPLILTNQHCITQEVRIVEVDEVADDGTVRRIRRQITMPTIASQDILDAIGVVIGRRETRVEIVAVNADADLALLRAIAPLANPIAARLGSGVIRGERVYIVGNPAMYEGSVVEGIVSNVRREVSAFMSPLGRPWVGFQISGGTTGGNSGGAVYNTRGQLIGVPTAGRRDASFIGFAVPVDIIRKFLAGAGVK